MFTRSSLFRMVFDEHQKFRELIDLFHGKKMHAKALALLRQYVTTLYLGDVRLIAV